MANPAETFYVTSMHNRFDAKAARLVDKLHELAEQIERLRAVDLDRFTLDRTQTGTDSPHLDAAQEIVDKLTKGFADLDLGMLLGDATRADFALRSTAGED